MLGRLKTWLDKWPATERQTLERALSRRNFDDFASDLEEPRSWECARRWSDTSLSNAVRSYTYWLQFLDRHGEMDQRQGPSARATAGRLRAYVDELSSVSAFTRWTYLKGMRSTLEIVDPGGDRACLDEYVRRLKRLAQPSRDQSHLLVAPSDLFEAGIRRMDNALPFAETDPLQASRYRDGLMMAAIACKALRRKNFAGMTLDRNIRRNAADIYEVRFKKTETKQKRPIEAALSPRLTPYFDKWLATIRPMLLKGRASDALWLTISGVDLSPETFHNCFCKATAQELGKRINPHFVRKIVATGVAIAEPGQVKMIGALLDHSTDQSAAYNLADHLHASRVYLALLEEQRQRAIKMTRAQYLRPDRKTSSTSTVHGRTRKKIDD